MKKFKLRAPVTIATILSLLVLGIALSVLARGIRNQSESWQWVVHTREVLEHVQATLTLASEAEAAQRGFLLTGNERFVDSYRQARGDVLPELARLRELTRDNPRQQAALRPFEETVRMRIDLLERVMQMVRAGREPDLALLESGRVLKQKILAHAEVIRTQERRLLQERQQRVDSGRRELIAAFATTAAVAAFLVVLLWVVSSRDAARLLAERARLDATLRSIGDGVIATDLQGTVSLMNRVAEELTGISEPRGVGMRLDQVLRFRERSSGQPVALDDAIHDRGERAVLASNGGGEHAIELSAAPIAPNGAGATGTVLVFRDVTERNARARALAESERKLIEANQMLEQRVEERTGQIAEANAELRAFAHTVAHDLRAPLRNVEGFATALIEDEAERMSEDGRLFANRIVAAVVRMDRLITDLLAYSRLSRAELRLERVDLGIVMKTVLRDLEAQLGDSGARLDIAQPLPAVRGNATILVQVIANLVSNAVKFVDKGVVPHIGVSAARDGMAVRLLIADNGIGIAPEHREHVFGVFERLHGHERYPGTGIGLAIVKKGLERMDGTVRIMAREGGGSIFELSMPAAD